jgi:hypothetical protein
MPLGHLTLLAADSLDASVPWLPRQDTRIVTDRTVLTKFPLRLLVDLVSVSHLGIQPDHHLGRQRELIANRSVERLVHGILPKLLCFPSQFAQTITSRIRQLKRTQQGVTLLWRWFQFDLSGQFGAAIIFKYRRYSKATYSPTDVHSQLIRLAVRRAYTETV